jgi:hypothetical protein
MPYPYDTDALSAIPEAERESFAIRASRAIDTLTFNRIVGKYESLTDFQKGIISEAVSRLALWQYENADLLDSMFSGYSINGVSAQFGGSGVRTENGVTVPTEVYQLISQTGLCCRSFRF